MSDRFIPDGFVDDLKARVRLSDVVSRRVKLKKQGQGFVGLSPFQNEKTPSFYVYDDKGYYKCFSSGHGGDVINFVQETERVDFIEAIKRIAEIAGIEIPKPTIKDKEAYDRKARLLSICEHACQFFERKLTSPEGSEAREYLKNRGLSSESWKKYRLGYSPDGWRHILDYLKSLEFTTKEIIEAGLVKEKSEEGKSSTYDVFRNRIMFPIENTAGKVIAFGARALQPDEKPKYLNSPDGPLFHKSEILYRYKAARTALSASTARGLVVCEGYMDVIALNEAGIGYAVAPLGTAVTQQQLMMVWYASSEAVLCFDGDTAGNKAAHRTIDRALPDISHKHQLFFVMLPDGLDPDDLIRRHGRNKMLEMIDDATPLIDLLWHRERFAGALDTPERQAGLFDRLNSLVELIQDPNVKKAYRQTLYRRANDLGFELRHSRPRKSGHYASNNGALIKPTYSLVGLGNLAYTIGNPELLEYGREEVAVAKFSDKDVNFIRDAILDLSDSGEDIELETIRNYLVNIGKSRAAQKLDEIPTLRPLVSEEDKKEWLLAMERLGLKDDNDAPLGPLNEEEQDFEQNWKYGWQKVAERMATRAKMQEASNAF